MPAISALSGLRGLSGLAGGDVFSPRSVPGLEQDINPARGRYQDAGGTLLALADGDPLGRLLDQSGSGNDVAQSVAAKRPTLKWVSNGPRAFWAARFDGVDDFLQFVSPLGVNGGSVYCVCRWNLLSSYSFCLGNSAGSEGYLREEGTASNRLMVPEASVYTTLWQDGAQVNVSSGGFPDFTVADLRQCHVYAMPANSGTVSLAYVGQNVFNNDSWWSGDLVRLLVYRAAHTAAQRQQVERGLGRLYGISVP